MKAKITAGSSTQFIVKAVPGICEVANCKVTSLRRSRFRSLSACSPGFLKNPKKTALTALLRGFRRGRTPREWSPCAESTRTEEFSRLRKTRRHGRSCRALRRPLGPRRTNECGVLGWSSGGLSKGFSNEPQTPPGAGRGGVRKNKVEKKPYFVGKNT